VNVALFGGTFDPVHIGHLSAAQAAMKAFALDEIHFVPASIPPHKRKRTLTAFAHRYAMVALGCAGVPQFIPSLLEEPGRGGEQPNYSLLTVRKMASNLAPADRLYFLLGADAFLDIPQWHEPAALLQACDFIIVSRPGFRIEEIESVIPSELKKANSPSTEEAAVRNQIVLGRSHLYLLNTVKADISSSTIRQLAAEGKALDGLVPDAVSDYIEKLNLFRDGK
jgi:nicotinate-nucleotide adenylyltransferase